MTMTAIYFTAPLIFSEPPEKDGDKTLPQRFSGVAYSGGLVPSWDGQQAIDLDSIEIDPDLPVLYQHDPESYIGVAQGAQNGRELTVSGTLFSDIDLQAQLIAQKSQRGAKWQLSIGLFDAMPEAHKDAVTVNGRSQPGPITILKGGIVREVSIVALGADRDTSTEFFSNNRGPLQMSTDPNDGARITELEAQITALTTRAEAAENALETERRTAREVALTALFRDLGHPCPDAAKPHYLALSAEAFSAIAAELRTMKRPPGAHLFAEQATGDLAADVAPTLNQTSIYSARRLA